MKIFLDDVRNVPDSSWVVVRSVDEFYKTIKNTKDAIIAISFDHDLGLNDDDSVAPSGMDAVKWLIDYIQNDRPEIGVTLKELTVHSSNPAGADNIIGYCRSAKRHDILNSNVKINRVQYNS